MLTAKCSFLKFKYSIFDSNQQLIGSLELPNYAMIPRNGWAKKALPKKYQDAVQINLRGHPYHLECELLSNRMISNDYRYFLLGGGNIIASADARVGHSTYMFESSGSTYSLVDKGGIFSIK